MAMTSLQTRTGNRCNFNTRLLIAKGMIGAIGGEERRSRCSEIAVFLSNPGAGSIKRTTPSPARTRRSARAARPAVRQTFAARKAKAADSGGGSDSDGPCRPQHTNQNHSTLNPALSTVRNGGAK